MNSLSTTNFTRPSKAAVFNRLVHAFNFQLVNLHSPSRHGGIAVIIQRSGFAYRLQRQTQGISNVGEDV